MSDRILEIMNGYAGFELGNDGEPDIQQLRYLPFETAAEQPPRSGRLILVLVEPRILASIPGLDAGEGLVERLERYKGDLRAEGLHSRFIEAEVYDGDEHKDGQVLLALRRFLIDVRGSFPRFEGVVLIGSFPEASLVRRWSWASPHKCSDPVWDEATPHLAIVPEPVSTRTEIVLADLNGNWEQLYHRQIDIPAWLAGPSSSMGSGWRSGETINDCVFESNEYVTGTLSFEDCFYVDDANFTILSRDDAADPKLRVRVRTVTHNPEVAAEDRNSVNVIARPDICVSRINARNIAYDPAEDKLGSDGQGFLDAKGDPRTVPSSDGSLVPGNQVGLFTQANPGLERRLYNRYFDRNHRFRVGAWSKQPFRPAVISGTDEFKAKNYVGVLKEAATDFEAEVLVDDASPLDYVNFLATPAPLKYVIAHSSPWNSTFDGDYEPAALEAACGGKPFRWHYDNPDYRPSFEDQGQAVDWFIHRTLFHYHTLDDAGASLVIHGGCDVNTVPGTVEEVYGDMDYARWQNAESILFGSNAVALLSRAKTFNDAPWGMGRGLRTGLRANFGNAWRGYYEAQASDAALAPIVVQNKRAYFWSITGDWTLRLRNKNGVGILALKGSKLEDEAIHPNQAWIDGWNLDSARNRIVGTGDFEGGGRASFVVTSGWGMGILKHDGTRWRQLVGAPRDTWFGAWRWDARVNRTRDVVRAVENFTGSGHAELLVTSSWGMGVLRRAGATMHATRAYKSGTRIGGWVYDVSNNRYWGTGDFTGDGRHELLIKSPWGVGLLTMQGNTHLAMHKSGERLGGWVLDVSNNACRLIGDFDGDGRAEFLIESPWGVGVLELAGGKLRSTAMHAWGSELGHGYELTRGDRFRVCGRLRGLGRDEILVARRDAWFILSLSGGKLHAVTKLSPGQRIGGWNFDPSNNRPRFAAPLAGNTHEQVVVTSPWGIGVLEFDDTQAPRCRALHPYDAMLGDWHYRSSDAVLGAANFMGGAGKQELLVLKRRP